MPAPTRRQGSRRAIQETPYSPPAGRATPSARTSSSRSARTPCFSSGAGTRTPRRRAVQGPAFARREVSWPRATETRVSPRAGPRPRRTRSCGLGGNPPDPSVRSGAIAIAGPHRRENKSSRAELRPHTLGSGRREKSVAGRAGARIRGVAIVRSRPSPHVRGRPAPRDRGLALRDRTGSSRRRRDSTRPLLTSFQKSALRRPTRSEPFRSPRANCALLGCRIHRNGPRSARRARFT